MVIGGRAQQQRNSPRRLPYSVTVVIPAMRRAAAGRSDSHVERMTMLWAPIDKEGSIMIHPGVLEAFRSFLLGGGEKVNASQEMRRNVADRRQRSSGLASASAVRRRPPRRCDPGKADIRSPITVASSPSARLVGRVADVGGGPPAISRQRKPAQRPATTQTTQTKHAHTGNKALNLGQMRNTSYPQSRPALP
jgi:hypothetical protein